LQNLNASLGAIAEADILVMPRPPIQGVGNDAGFTMQVQLRDGSFDMTKLHSVTNAIVANAKTQTALQLVLASFRSNIPQYQVDRVKTQAMQVSLDQVFAALGTYLGFELRRPVQQIRPCVPDLRAGRRAGAATARGRPEHVRA
jgi:hydrophobic/amphiphilic exporter-1 (mainly G- bacteria), HAE1 family